MSPERWREIEEVFEAAVEMPAADRVRFLDERCKDDPTLKAEVVKLLKSDDSAADFIEERTVALDRPGARKRGS